MEEKSYRCGKLWWAKDDKFLFLCWTSCFFNINKIIGLQINSNIIQKTSFVTMLCTRIYKYNTVFVTIKQAKYSWFLQYWCISCFTFICFNYRRGVCCVEVSSMSAHPLVKGLNRSSVSLNIHTWLHSIRYIICSFSQICSPPQFGVKTEIIENFYKQAQDITKRDGDYQTEGVRLGHLCISVQPPCGQQDAGVYQYKCVVDQTPVSGVSFNHVKPAEVPDEPYGCPVESFPRWAVHEIGALPPGP